MVLSSERENSKGCYSKREARRETAPMVHWQPILIAKLWTPDAIYSLAHHMVLITGHGSHIHQQRFVYNWKSLNFLSSVLKRHVQSNSTCISWMCSKTPFSSLVTSFVAYFSSMWSYRYLSGRLLQTVVICGY